MHMDPTPFIEQFVVLGHLDSAMYLFRTPYFVPFFVFLAFFSLHTDMVFEYPHDKRTCCFLLLAPNKHIYSILFLFSITLSSFYQYVFPNLNNIANFLLNTHTQHIILE